MQGYAKTVKTYKNNKQQERKPPGADASPRQGLGPKRGVDSSCVVFLLGLLGVRKSMSNSAMISRTLYV